ncbi:MULTISPECIES: zinc-binding alcohol dehydrogenase family protein [unclassified Enterococcus]|jgi:NADPH2:quinone reductase|uniref:zinc-binding alcohol dehydrogenase family protein n=1 Tax=unclassified Enterococcus TaxID=2608891 RepID=UPI003D297400
MSEKQMKRVGFYEGLPIKDENSFLDETGSIPVPKGKDLLVAVHAVSVNPVDTKFRQIAPKSEKFTVLGFDAVGEVVAVGEEVENFKVGDRVYYAGSSKRDGSNQEFQLVDERIAAMAPKTCTNEEAAAFPLVSLTAYELLFEKFQLVPEEGANAGQSILVINSGGGVGTMMTQLANWSGLTVYGTASPKNFSWLSEHGVHHPLDYHHDLAEQLENLGGKVDYIAVLHDLTTYAPQITKLIKPLGHVGAIVGTNEPIAIGEWKNLSISFHWEYMFAKTDYDRNVETQGQILTKIAELADAGKLHSPISKADTSGINAQSLKKATAAVETGHEQGKIVISGGFK